MKGNSAEELFQIFFKVFTKFFKSFQLLQFQSLLPAGFACGALLVCFLFVKNVLGFFSKEKLFPLLRGPFWLW